MALIELTVSTEASNQVQCSDDFKQIFAALIQALQTGNNSAAEVAFTALKRNFQKVQRTPIRKRRRKLVHKRLKTTPTLVNSTSL